MYRSWEPPVFWAPTGDTTFAFFAGTGVLEAESEDLFLALSTCLIGEGLYGKIQNKLSSI